MTVSEKSIEESFITFLKGENLELYDLNIANYPSISKIEIYIYSPESLDHSIIERLTYHFHGVLHDLNIEKGTYELIVSSPGLERKLRTRRHFELAIGEHITLKTINLGCLPKTPNVFFVLFFFFNQAFLLILVFDIFYLYPKFIEHLHLQFFLLFSLHIHQNI